MIDTVLLGSAGGGHPESYFHTDEQGTVRRKSDRFLRCVCVQPFTSYDKSVAVSADFVLFPFFARVENGIELGSTRESIL